MNKWILSGTLFLAIVLVLGCTGSQTNDGAEEQINPMASNISFTAPETLPNATAGIEYLYSFCEPDSAAFSGTCGDGNETIPTNPEKGNPPQYTFVNYSIVPAGLMLRTNGILTGTPTAAGTYDLNVCANDLRKVVCINTSVTVLPALEIYDAKILDMSCKWRTEIGDYDIEHEIVRVIVRGTAQGPVGARLELPILAWSDDDWDCGEWTHYTGALIAVGHTCKREAGDPERMNWTVDTGEQSPIRYYFGESRSYSVKIYENGDIYSKAEDSESTQCEG